MKVEVLNVTNNQKQIAFNTTVQPDPNSPLDANGRPDIPDGHRRQVLNKG